MEDLPAHRDGTIGHKGCISGEEGSGEFAGSRALSIRTNRRAEKGFYRTNGIQISILPIFKISPILILAMKI